MAISYMLGMGKLTRMLRNHGTGKNVLKIDIVQNQSGNINLIISLESVILTPAPGGPNPPLPGGAEQACPVPPGCDENGNCRSTAADHLKGNALNYIVASEGAGESFDDDITLVFTPVTGN